MVSVLMVLTVVMRRQVLIIDRQIKVPEIKVLDRKEHGFLRACAEGQMENEYVRALFFYRMFVKLSENKTCE